MPLTKFCARQILKKAHQQQEMSLMASAFLVKKQLLYTIYTKLEPIEAKISLLFSCFSLHRVNTVFSKML